MAGLPLTQTDVPDVLRCLQAALQPAGGVQKQAEAHLAALEDRPGFCSCLAEIMMNKDADHSARWLASVQLKNTVAKHWRAGRIGDERGIGREEKAHLRSRLVQLIVQDDNQVAVQIALVWAKVARQDYPNDWPSLFADLLGLLGGPGATQLAVRRTLLVVHTTIKELATKRLASDQKHFAQVAQQLFGPMWTQWVTDTSALLAGLPVVLADGGSPAASGAQQLLIILERWIILIKVLRRLLVFGHTSDHKSLRPVQEISVCVPAMLQALQQLVAIRGTAHARQHASNAAGANGTGGGLPGHQRHHLLTMLDRGVLKLTRVLVALQDTHPWSFHACSALIPTLSFCCDQILANQGHGGGMGVAATAWDRYLIQCMCFIMQSLSCPAYRGKTAGGADLAPDGPDGCVGGLVGAVRGALDAWCAPDRLTALAQALIASYGKLTAHDIEEWQSSSEEFYHQGDVSGYREHLGLAAQALFLALLQDRRPLLCPLVVRLVSSAAAACPLDALASLQPGSLAGPVASGVNPPLAVPEPLLALDAALWAVCQAAYELHEYLDYVPLLHGTLLPALVTQGPVLRILRRRALMVITSCVARLPGDDRPAVYRAVLTCMGEADACMRLTAVACLHALVDDWNFAEQQFEPFLGPTMQALVATLSTYTELDSQTQAFNLMNMVIERMGDLIRPFVEPLASLLPGLWAAAEGQSLLRIQVLLAVQRLVNVLGSASPTLDPLLLPLLTYATDPSQPEALHLLEDGLGLWLVALRNAPGPAPHLLALLPHLTRVLAASTEHIAVAMALVTSAALMARDTLGPHAHDVAAIFSLLLGAVNERGMLLVLPALETVLVACPTALPALRPALLKLLDLLLDGQETPQVQAYACCVLARVLLVSPPELAGLLASRGKAAPPGLQLARISELWTEHFDALAQPRQRKLAALGLCALLAATPTPEVLANLDALVACVTGVWAELEGGPPQGGGDSAAAQWAMWAAADSGCEALLSVVVASEDAEGECSRRQQLRASDCVPVAKLSGAMRMALEAAGRAAGPALDVSLASLDPTLAAQLQVMLAAA